MIKVFETDYDMKVIKMKILFYPSNERFVSIMRLIFSYTIIMLLEWNNTIHEVEMASVKKKRKNADETAVYL